MLIFLKDAIDYLAILKDDVHDIGRFDRPHHWHVGLAGFLLSLALANLAEELLKARLASRQHEHREDTGREA